MASSSYCYQLAAKYKQTLDAYKESLEKDLEAMTLENASAKTDMENAVSEITKLCDLLKSSIDSYYFE